MMKPRLSVAILLCIGISPAMGDVIAVNPHATEALWETALRQPRTPAQPVHEKSVMPAPPSVLALVSDLSNDFAQAAHIQTLEGDSVSAGQQFSRVPEPGSFALFGAGLLGLAFIRHRRSS